jgi:hypothetical protein
MYRIWFSSFYKYYANDGFLISYTMLQNADSFTSKHFSHPEHRDSNFLRNVEKIYTTLYTNTEDRHLTFKKPTSYI